MPLFLEDSQKVANKGIEIPSNAKKVFKAMEKSYEPYLDTVQGGHVLKRLARTPKNDKKAKTEKEKQDRSKLSVDNAKVILHRQSKFSPNSIQYQLYGGELGRNILKKGTERARGVNKVDAVKPPKPTTNAQLKPQKPSSKDISTPNGGKIRQIKTENRIIKESGDYHIFYDYLNDYGVWYVLDMFFSKNRGERQNWAPLINPSMYQKALSEFTKYGKLINFPTKYVYQWMGIIMKNTAILETCTELAGHTQFFPSDEVSEYAESQGYEIGDSFEEGSEWLDEIGFYDWSLMPDGSDAMSDFGLEPIMKVINEYDEGMEPEKVLVLVNRILDIYHCRGDLSSIFIEGGRNTLSRISEEVKMKKGKKIYINENTLKRIYKLWLET